MTDTKKPIQPDPKPKTQDPKPSLPSDPKPTDIVTCRVKGPGPLTTPEGVKAKGQAFKCSRKQAKTFGDLVTIS